MIPYRCPQITIVNIIEMSDSIKTYQGSNVQSLIMRDKLETELLRNKLSKFSNTEFDNSQHNL